MQLRKSNPGEQKKNQPQADAKADMTAAPLPPQTKTSHKKAQRNEPRFDARTQCYRVLGVDLTAVPGFQTPTVLVLLCELGPEFAEKFATAKHFGSWLGLCPDNRITGGKIYSVRTRDVKSRVASLQLSLPPCRDQCSNRANNWQKPA